MACGATTAAVVCSGSRRCPIQLADIAPFLPITNGLLVTTVVMERRPRAFPEVPKVWAKQPIKVVKQLQNGREPADPGKIAIPISQNTVLCRERMCNTFATTKLHFSPTGDGRGPVGVPRGTPGPA